MKLSNWLNIILAAVAIILLFFMFRGCKANTAQLAKIDSLTKANDRVVSEAKIGERILNIGIDTQERVIDSIKVERDKAEAKVGVLEVQLDRAVSKASATSYRVKAAKIDRDTAGYITNCDTLAEQVLDRGLEIMAYKEAVHDLWGYAEAISTHKDSIITAKDRIINIYRTALDTVYANSKEQGKIAVKAVKANKRNRTALRITSGALLAALAKILFFTKK